ncbi:MAG TPA: hypothetical protein VJV78_32635 [Polyangiales bacterium]|nr:hypothetical protein [Polyangiales bacterium]
MGRSLPRHARPCGTLKWWSAIGIVLCLVVAGPVRAQSSERWLLLPVLAGEKSKAPEPAAIVRELESELRGAGRPSLSNATAGGMFESQHSSEPVQLGSDELRRLSKQVSTAARHLALGELPDAQRAMESVNALSGPARDYLNRETARARKIFDNCLMASYLWERAEQHQPALRQMLECTRSFPGFRPEGRAYPAEVRRLFEEAALQQSQLEPSALRVQSVGRNGCGVRLNGMDVGKSPLLLNEVRSGNARVQLECDPGSVGRIHNLELKPGDNEVSIDPLFDAAVHSQGGLWLAYPNERERDKRAAADAQTIGLALGVRVVMLWNVPGALGSDIAVRPLGTEPNRELARAGFAADSGYAQGGPSKLISALLQWSRSAPAEVPAAASGRVDLPLPPPPPPPPPTAATPPPSAAQSGRHYTQQHAVAGAILAVVGGASCAVSWALYAERQSKRTAIGDTSQVSNYKKLGAIAITTQAVGASLLSVSEYFWLPDDPEVPALAWAAGALGLGVGVTAVTLALTVSDCKLGDNRVGCQHFWADHFFGPMLFLQALPLMTVPLWYGLRVAFRPAGVQVSWTGQGLSLRGGF